MKAASSQTEHVHPRPQLTREGWVDLCGQWGFAFDDADAGLRERWFERPAAFTREITVPFPPESAASGVHDPSFHRVLWYRREFAAPRAERLVLRFGAVDYRASVWVNGQLVATHEGGHTPFSADISGVVRSDVNVLVVRAEDDPADLAQPRGKQDWQAEAHAIWYDRTSGIWQPVWLEPLPDVFIESVRWTPDLERYRLQVRVKLNAPAPQGARLRVRLGAQDLELVDDSILLNGSVLERDIGLDPSMLAAHRADLVWTPRRPNLLDAQVSLELDGATLDDTRGYVGLRSVGVGGGQFLLNGSAYFLRLVLAQNFWPESHLAAPSDEALRREVELVKSLGFNGVRIHQKVENPRFLYWCDRLGLVVWGEMANAYVFTPEAQRRLTREWLDVIERDASHPCIVTWVPINESWGVPNLETSAAQRQFVSGLYFLTKSLDPSRPVIGNDGWELVSGDILGVHDYAVDGSLLRERYGSQAALDLTLAGSQPSRRHFYLSGQRRAGEPVMLTEFGGLSHAPGASDRWWGYGTLPTTEALLEKYEEVVSAVLDSPVLAGFCYTQLTDTQQETNGLLFADRTPKLDPERVRAVTARVSRSIQSDVIWEIHAAAEDRARERALAAKEVTRKDR